MKQSPSDHLFVVRVDPRDRSTVSRDLAPLGRVQPLEGSDILLLSLAEPHASGPAWRHAQEILGSMGTVQPVLLDEEGESHYPTGEISVRFTSVPQDEDLHRFAREHGLRLLRRNEFVPQQAVFRPVDASRSYLPELVEKIEQEDVATAAWANTLSRYRRAALP